MPCLDFVKDQTIKKKLDGEPCCGKRKEHYNYCCADHNPVFQDTYIRPRDLALENLRGDKMSDIIQLYNNKNAYHEELLPTSLRDYQLDHKFELQSAAYSIRNATVRNDKLDKEDREIVVEFLRDNALNEDYNLAFTKTTTNKIKGGAVKKFLDDMLTKHQKNPFTSYMIDEFNLNGTNERVSRTVTKTIRAEVKKANKACQYKLEDETDSPSFCAVQKQFKKLNVYMNT
ncbi:hypothetical protein BBJ29_009513 [Phytophthora kernoviae]|uniref:Uncharacterized protein n=1 Tax=Phytophthora kernoviae TaxID=325452 RepID=A0A3F2RKA3_9STRA|nr:hypothetical protein BBP00_00006682 [Phytophthora kernoviae]RLN60720.1 hypothetical protein BBJ29_009513 [Phytophthora kernoviae]